MSDVYAPRALWAPSETEVKKLNVKHRVEKDAKHAAFTMVHAVNEADSRQHLPPRA